MPASPPLEPPTPPHGPGAFPDASEAGEGRGERPPTAADPSVTDADPHGMGAALARLMGGSRRTARAAALSVAGALEPGERVELGVAGRFRAFDGIMLLTDRRLIMANDRQWQPEIVSVTDLSGVVVEGWLDRREAVLRITAGDDVHVFDRIKDSELAQRLAAAIRAR